MFKPKKHVENGTMVKIVRASKAIDHYSNSEHCLGMVGVICGASHYTPYVLWHVCFAGKPECMYGFTRDEFVVLD